MQDTITAGTEAAVTASAASDSHHTQHVSAHTLPAGVRLQLWEDKLLASHELHSRADTLP